MTMSRMLTGTQVRNYSQVRRMYRILVTLITDDDICRLPSSVPYDKYCPYNKKCCMTMILIMGLPNSSTVAGCRVDYDNMKYVRSSRVRMTRQSCSTEEIFVQMFLD
ncbi:hypothetical protein NP493_2077g00004 [Ridgeia piscesae]|uniref:Uncharacterized protein n=1 Tax=Ridgeia piscesae TaxID=27915 RepID=A0AAD9JLM7_RIDPI|nr:hypothetical protein NP493_2077g00004 [Ridgeia piscesae]